MQASATQSYPVSLYPVRVAVVPSIESRNRVTVFFRPLLALPHLLLVGGPVAIATWWTWRAESGGGHEWSASGGVLGAVAVVSAIIAWFAILFTGRHPDGLWQLAAFYLRWRANAIAYLALLRDEYPPFGDGSYPVELELTVPPVPRDKLTVGFRVLLIIPHLVVLWLLGAVWFVSTVAAWFAVLFTRRMPAGLATFGAAMLRWNIRVEAYALLLVDEYPPFSLE